MGTHSGENTPPSTLSRTTSFLLNTPITRRSSILELQNSTQKRKLETLQVESAFKLQRHASTIEALHQRIDKLESDRKRLFDENIELKSLFEKQKLIYQEELRNQEDKLQSQLRIKGSLQDELSGMKQKANKMALLLEHQEIQFKAEIENAKLQIKTLQEDAHSLEALVEERDLIIRSFNESQSQCLSSNNELELRSILQEAAKNSQIIGVKYKRLLKEVQALRNLPAEKLALEEILKRQQIRLDLLESIEKQFHELEYENERLKASRINGSEMQLKEARETICTLQEEFEALNDSNSLLMQKLSALEMENINLNKCRNSLLDKIAELENINHTLEDLVPK